MTFTDFIKSKHYNFICDKLSEYVEDNKSHFSCEFPILNSVDNIYIDTPKIITSKTHKISNSTVTFDVVVKADLEAYDFSNKTENSANTEQWFSVKCTSNFKDNLNHIEILNFGNYTKDKKSIATLNDEFVPIITKDNLDITATNFLNKYYPEALKHPQKIDTTKLANKMGLRIIKKHISSDRTIFGQIYFKNCDATFWNNNNNPICEKVSSDTIVIEPDIFYLRNIGSINHTIVHECVHKEYHYNKFVFDSLCGKDLKSVNCLVSENQNITKAYSYMEWQANSLASHILMPKDTFSIIASELINEYSTESGTNDLTTILPKTIDSLAEFFGVSKISAKIRLIEIGYESAVGIYDYIDNHYIRNYFFKKGSLKPKQTFSINTMDAIKLTFTDYKFRDHICKGKYIYSESHFVLNDAKYIEHDKDNTPILTSYALYHMDECCLIFNINCKEQENIYHVAECFNRGDHSPFTFSVTYRDGIQNSQNNDLKKNVLSSEILELSKLFATLPEDFAASLEKIVEWRGLSRRDLKIRSGLSEKTLQRAFNNENISLESAMRLCIALQVPYYFSEKLIGLSGNMLRATNPTHVFYIFVLSTYYAKTVDFINKFLNDNNIASI